MLEALGFVVIAAAMVTALTNWKLGLQAAILTAVVQDPLRKLVPGEPIYFILVAGAVFAVACAAAMSAGVQFNPNRIFGWRRYVAMPANVFVVLLAVQAVLGFVHTGSVVVVGIGLLSYLAPVPAVMFAYHLAIRGGADTINRVLLFYVIVTGIALSTVVMQFAGFNWQILGEVGNGITIYDFGTILEANSGIYRASEVAAWHAATCASFALLLLSARKRSLLRVAMSVLIVAAVLWVGVLTGRRKVLAEFILFACSYFALWAFFLRGGLKTALAAAVVGMVAYSGFLSFVGADSGQAEGPTQDMYVARGQTVFGDMGARFDQLGLGPVVWAYQRFGPLGGGVGLGSQGAAQFGAQSQGAAEGGLGKITLELGVPGLLIAMWLAVGLFRHIWYAMKFTERRSPALAPLQFGLAGLLLANVGTFAVATQVYADPTILLLLGTMLGFLLAMPALAERDATERHARQRAPTTRRMVARPAGAHPLSSSPRRARPVPLP